MEKNMENEMETGILQGIIGSVVFDLGVLWYPMKSKIVSSFWV